MAVSKLGCVFKVTGMICQAPKKGGMRETLACACWYPFHLGLKGKATPTSKTNPGGEPQS